MKTFIDLFCGIGGFHVALAGAGLCCRFASDIDAAAQAAYKANFGLRPEGDISAIPAEAIPAHDVLCAGFPCQPFSKSNRNARGMDETRGTLFFDIVRIAKHHRPAVLLLENVPTILTFDKGQVLYTILRQLDRIGYDTAYYQLNAADYGAATARPRIYFVATRKDLGLVSHRPEEREEIDIVANHLRPDLVAATEDMFGSSALWRNIADYKIIERTAANNRPRQLAHAKRCAPSAGSTGSQGTRIYDINHPAPSMAAGGRNEFAHTEGYLIGGRPRRLLPQEAKTIQGFPAEHVITAGAEGYKQIGNSVVPRMIRAVYDGLTCAKITPHPRGRKK